jgi:genome maintenance exonuclease 1
MKIFNYVKNTPKIESLAVEEYEGKRYYISPNGIRLPSVTTVLGHFKKQSLIEWQNRIGEKEATSIKNRAGVRGSKYHLMMERYLNNQDNVFEGIMPDMKQSFKDAQPTLDKIDNIYYMECPLYSEVLGVAGRTDLIAEYDNELSIIDHKTSLREKRESWIQNYFEQGTAYSLMFEELTDIRINKIVIIISVDGLDKPQVFVKDRIYYIDSLMEKIEQYKKDCGDVY